MRPPGSFKFTRNRRGADGTPAWEFDDPQLRSERRSQRIVESIRNEIAEGSEPELRIRRIFSDPREIFRLELELPQLGYQRTTLLDRDALEALLEADEVRALVARQLPTH